MSECNPPERFRLFIAITIPPSVKRAIEDAQAELRRALPEQAARWTRPEQFHLTLRFLGSVESARIALLTDAVRQACSTFTPLQLRAESVGFFPNARRPRVLWVGMFDSAGQLVPLQTAIQAATLSFTTEAPEEKFSGHVTLARFKNIRPQEAHTLSAVAASMANKLFGEWTASAVELIRSQLSPQGASYTTVAVLPLST